MYVQIRVADLGGVDPDQDPTLGKTTRIRILPNFDLNNSSIFFSFWIDQGRVVDLVGVDPDPTFENKRPNSDPQS